MIESIQQKNKFVYDSGLSVGITTMKKNELKIVSGGQTGADRGGLLAAMDLGLDWGGWAPKGWRSEDGAIPSCYREKMQEIGSAKYHIRSRC